MLTLDRAFPTATFLANYYAPIPRFWRARRGFFFAVFNSREYREKKAAPAGEPHPKELLPDPLGVNPALADGSGYAIDGQHVSRDAVIHMMVLGIAHHGLEGLDHDVLQLFVDHRLLPKVPLAVLHPLEVRSRHAAGIGQDVGHDEHVLVGKDIVGCGCRRAVR